MHEFSNSLCKHASLVTGHPLIRTALPILVILTITAPLQAATKPAPVSQPTLSAGPGPQLDKSPAKESAEDTPLAEPRASGNARFFVLAVLLAVYIVVRLVIARKRLNESAVRKYKEETLRRDSQEAALEKAAQEKAAHDSPKA